MSVRSKIETLSICAKNLWRTPRQSIRRLAGSAEELRAARLVERWRPTSPGNGASCSADANPLRTYFDTLVEGPGVWKWLHYFDLYHRHLEKFVGRDMSLVEVGVYSGGSLGMWRHFFGPGCHIHGIDIEEACREYEGPGTTIHIGDQADRAFWARFRRAVPDVDVFIDDGGHEPEQQMVTLEEMLPHLRPGGVYVCEDVHGVGNGFAAFVQSLSDALNAFSRTGRRWADLGSSVTA